MGSTAITAVIDLGRIAQRLGLPVARVEATALLVYHRTTGAGPAPWELLTFLGAGGSLMVSMLFVRRVERYPLHFAFALLAALGFHAAHVVLLWSR